MHWRSLASTALALAAGGVILLSSSAASAGDPVPGVAVEGKNSDGQIVVVATTDNGGRFSALFSQPGDYTVSFHLVVGSGLPVRVTGAIETVGDRASVPPAPSASPIPPVACRVDPAIVSFTLQKGGPGQIRAVVQVYNNGSDAWHSTPGLQNLIITLHNAKTGAMLAPSFTLPIDAPGSAQMGTYSTPFFTNAFDAPQTQTNPFASQSPPMGGTAEARLEYSQSVWSDRNPCNDDQNTANNFRSVRQDQVQAFLVSSDQTRGF